MGIGKVPRVGLHLFFVKCKIAPTDLHYLTHMDNLHEYSLVLIACVGDGTSGKHKHLEYRSSFTISLLFPIAPPQLESMLSPNSRLVLRKHELGKSLS